MTVSVILSDVVTRLDAKKTAAGYTAKCPAHDDNRASLSIAQGDDGKILFKCHAGCDFGAITSSLGLDMSDCFAPDETRLDPPPRLITRKPPRVYAEREKAVAVCLKNGVTETGRWHYHNEDGQNVGMVVRLQDPDGKKNYRPFSLVEGGWCMAGMPAPRPLYRLYHLIKTDSKILVIVEGEKCADEVVKLGFMATTSAGGANAAGHTDWKPASAFDEVWIIPDNDPPGMAYAEDVERQIKSHDPACLVKVIGLPGLSAGGDIVDWIDAHGDAAEPNTLRQEFEQLARNCDTDRGWSCPEVAAQSALCSAVEDSGWLPFPTEALPPVMRRFVDDGASSIGCDASYLALPLLALAGGAIGATRVVELKPDWKAPPILWVALVGRPSSLKTPALSACFSLVNAPQRRWRDEHAFAMARYKGAMAKHEKAMALWKKNKGAAGEPPTEPDRPACRRFVVADTTEEALAAVLSDNHRGLLLWRDELAGWFSSFTRYSSTSDAPFYLSCFNGAAHTVDRRGRQDPLYLDRPLVGIVGGIQDKVLRRHLTGENLENGLASRLLFCAPPVTPRRWTNATMPELTRENMAQSLASLLAVRGKPDGAPDVLVLTEEAEALFQDWYNQNGAGIDRCDDENYAACLGKIEEVPGRLSIILTLLNDLTATAVSGETMANAIKLARWFGHEAKRFYDGFGVSPDESNKSKLIELIRKEGTMTARDAQRRCRWLKGSGMAEKALEQLRRDGLVDYEVITRPEGGRPATVYRLRGSVDTGKKAKQ
jgi:hypothetical protein